ncbi:MAG: GNAT family N-acetyltransferase [Eubacteriales bacterium]|nr:GNAT family N-acetyltransferase [Eubacteriales bacterium]
MTFTPAFAPHARQITSMAYEGYCRELSRHPALEKMDPAAFDRFFRPQAAQMRCAAALENGVCTGFVLYTAQEEDGRIACRIPVWGYGASGAAPEKTLSRLFQQVADEIVQDRPVDFSVHLYAHDTPIKELFSYLQFGIVCETTVRRIQTSAYTGPFVIRPMPKDELLERWAEVWALLAQLIAHLRESPVFYPGTEFTEAVYRDFFTQEDTTVYVAQDGDTLIGLIEANGENLDIAFPNAKGVNVGEAFVLPAYRGTQTAQGLLSCLENDLLTQGIGYDWVTHGTANPNARGFWNRYFETIEYEFIRSIALRP